MFYFSNFAINLYIFMFDKLRLNDANYLFSSFSISFILVDAERSQLDGGGNGRSKYSLTKTKNGQSTKKIVRQKMDSAN